ncbi:MAG: hypothetical protein EVA50_01415 [Gammaproteobacteria bacterium]|jgi:uncharacterized protein YfkK (UPF0435 family)|nr:MAG: hypothetical protein EVA50_01415 [Gammaproteobacteria bacterium]|tara:strand:- start:281 stop:469 length:189 start_codon:yes stop_codon:yes gene_type:complete
MQANRFHLGKVIEEINKNLINSDLMKEAKLKSNGIESTVFAFYLILRSEQISSDETFPLRKL